MVARSQRSARRDRSPRERKKLLMSVYNRSPIGNKHLRGGKHMIMFTGPSAKTFGVENYSTVVLEDLSDAELEKAARAIGAVSSDRDRKSSLLRVGQTVYARFATRVAPSLAYIARGTQGTIVEVIGRTSKSRRYRVRWRAYEGETGWYDAEALSKENLDT